MAREMKDSGYYWIGKIPINWKIRKVKDLYQIQTGFTPDTKREEYYADEIEGYDWLTIGDLHGKMYIPHTTKKHISKLYVQKFSPSIIPKGSLLYSFKLSVGQVSITNRDIYSNEAIASFMPHSGVCLEFLYYSSSMIVENANENIYGAKILNQELIRNARVVCPPIEEQKKIALFLNKKCSELDNVLEKTRASIEEYKKLKQAVITKVVTKGIRGDREMKDSQSIWFGQIPSDWNMRKIKYIFKIQKDIAGEEGHTVLSITQKGIKPKDLSKNEGQLAENYSNYQLVHIGDFAMNHMDLLTGWVDVSKYEGVTSPDYRVFGLIDKDNYCSQYYLYLMQMCYMNRIFYGLGQGVSGLGRWRLQADKFLNFSITVPSYEEQQEIANYLDKKCSAIDELIAKKEQYLSEIENYKKSLIYEYVTGKKEVPQE